MDSLDQFPSEPVTATSQGVTPKHGDTMHKVAVATAVDTREEHIDTRGVWPVYIKGVLAVSLIGKPHTITVAEARDVVAHILRG